MLFRFSEFQFFEPSFRAETELPGSGAEGYIHRLTLFLPLLIHWDHGTIPVPRRMDRFPTRKGRFLIHTDQPFIRTDLCSTLTDHFEIHLDGFLIRCSHFRKRSLHFLIRAD